MRHCLLRMLIVLVFIVGYVVAPTVFGADTTPVVPAPGAEDKQVEKDDTAETEDEGEAEDENDAEEDDKDEEDEEDQDKDD